MSPVTKFQSINGTLFNTPHEALKEDFNHYQKILTREVSTFIPFGELPQKYDPQLAQLREHFLRFAAAGRAYIVAYQEYLKGLAPGPHAQAVYEATHQPQPITEELAPITSEVAA